MEPWPDDMPKGLYLAFSLPYDEDAAVARWHERIGPEPPEYVRDVQNYLRLGPITAIIDQCNEKG